MLICYIKLNFCITYLLWRCLQSVCALYVFFFFIRCALSFLSLTHNLSLTLWTQQNKAIWELSLWSSYIGHKGRILGKGYGINGMLLGKAWRTHRNLGNFEQAAHHTHTHNCSSPQALVASSKFGLHFKLEKVKLRNNP